MINLLIFLLLLFPPGRVSRRNIGEHSSDGEALAVVWAIRVAMFLFLFIIPICLDYFLSEGRFIFYRFHSSALPRGKVDLSRQPSPGLTLTHKLMMEREPCVYCI